jgi:hypothetical protein
MPLNFILSQQSTNLLIHEDNTFIKDFPYGEKTYWKCTENKKAGCRCRLHTQADEIVRTVGEHNHLPVKVSILSRQCRNEISDRARVAIAESPAAVVASAVASISEAVQGALPIEQNLKRLVKRARRLNESVYPTNPTSRAQIVIPEQLKKTLKNSNFILYDSGIGDANRIIIFGTQANLDMLKTSNHWYGDGTFKTCPSLFDQIYTIHAHLPVSHTITPLLYVLMPNKEQSTYVRALTEIKNLLGDFTPETIMMDFEKAAQNAFSQVFEGIIIRGCFFHFSQCLWRKIQQCPEVRELYIEEAQFALYLRRFAALAFVHSLDVIMKYEELMECPFIIQHANILEEFNSYFEDTWIGRPRLNGTRRPPLFPINVWSCYENVLYDLGKTNNTCEAWHRAFSSFISGSHPTIYSFIKKLQIEQGRHEFRIEGYLAGATPPPMKKTYRDSAKKIKTIVLQYFTTPTLLYLRGIAHNLQLQAHS